MPKRVVFVHGAWVDSLCWEKFRMRFEDRGWECVSPDWPYDGRQIAELRADPDPRLAGLGIREIVDHYDAIVRALDEPPVLVGHSFGGLFVQLLLDRGLGAAGVAIDPAPPRGVLPGPVAVRSSSFVLRTGRFWKRILTMPFEAFAATFAQTMSEPEQRAAYDHYVIPTPGRIFLQDALGTGTRIDYANSRRAPLLLIAGGEDRTVTAGMVRADFRKYRRSEAPVDLEEFPGRPHWLIASPGWKEVADRSLDWIGAHSG
jgi:pimeloyl-ACP methyl ester carboxylesterase